MNELSDRIPPQNLSAERSVLGSLMLDNDQLAEVADVIQPKDFYADAHGQIYRAFLALSESGTKFDVVTTAQQLEAQGALADIGGPPYLMECLETVPHAAHAVYYAGIVAACSRRRKAIEIGRKLIQDAFDFGSDAEAMTDAAISAANKLAESLPSGRSRKPRELSSHVEDLISNLEAGISPATFDGIEEIDQMTGGTCAGEIIVIAASTHHGKTLLGMQMLSEAARHGTIGGMISEEMAAIALASRTLTSITCVSSDQWMRETRRLRFDAKEHFDSHAKILVAEKCGSIASVERAIAELVERHDVKLIAVDYAQLIRGEGGNRQERCADVSTRLKNAAMKHEIRIILLAQLNRAIDLRDDPSPQMSDIADTSQIAKDADIVLMPFFPAIFDEHYEDKTEYRIYQRKNRNRGINRECLKMTINTSRLRVEPYQRTAVKDEWNNYEPPKGM